MKTSKLLSVGFFAFMGTVGMVGCSSTPATADNSTEASTLGATEPAASTGDSTTLAQSSTSPQSANLGAVSSGAGR